MDAARQAMTQAAEQAKRASAVVGRLRRLVEQPGLAPQAEPLDLNQAVAEALYLLEPELRRRQVQVKVQMKVQAADLPAAQADPVAVQQILHNLLVNALQAMQEQPPATRHLRVELERRDTRLLVAVQDSGPGVAPEMRQRLFTPFATGRAQGLGLGLTLSQSLAESMGGSLELAASGPGSGARFELLLPAADRKSTRLNSSHLVISYAVFCLKTKKQQSPDNQLALVGSNPFPILLHLSHHSNNLTPRLLHVESHHCRCPFHDRRYNRRLHPSS